MLNLLLHSLSDENAITAINNLHPHFLDVAKTECFLALKKIKAIIENDSLSDFECIEQIVGVYEQLGSDGGSRHDFG